MENGLQVKRLKGYSHLSPATTYLSSPLGMAEGVFVSFIIPYYNVSIPLLHECVDSIVCLDVPKEIIIVNDGCDVDLADFNDTCTIYKIEHGGLALARNYALDRANGKYVQFVDADDKLISQNYQTIIEVAEKSEPDIFYFNFTSNDRKQTETLEYKTTDGISFMKNRNIHGSACGYMFRRSLLGELRFTNGIFHEDEEFTPQLMLKANTLMHSDINAYYYRKSQQSIMTTRNEEHITKRLNDFLFVLLNLNDKRESLKEGKDSLQRRISQLSMDYLYNIIKLGRRNELKSRIQDLKQNNLYPLPLRHYTWKYYLAALITRI